MTGFFSSLRVRLLLIVFFATLPALAIIIHSGWEQRQLARDTAKTEMFNKINAIASFQILIFEEAHKELAILAELHTLQAHKYETCSAILNELLKKHLEYVNLGVADRTGKVTCSALPAEKEISLADRLYFQKVMETGRFAVGTYQVGLISGKVSIGVAYPIKDGRANLEAVIFAGLDLNWLQKLIAEGAREMFDPRANITVIDQDGTVLARWPEIVPAGGSPQPDTSIIKTVLNQDEGATEAYGLDGVYKVYAFTPLDRSRQVGFIYVGIPTTVLYAKIFQDLARNLIFLGLALTLALVAAWFLSSQLVLNRISLLLHAAQRISAGDLSARTGLPYGKGELDHLAHSFDAMARELQAREEEWQFACRTFIITNQAGTIDQLLNEFLVEIKHHSRCAGVGIRILGEDGQIPYQVYQGFSPKFYELESPFAINNDACMCTNVTKGTADSRLPFYTAYGSFYLNRTSCVLAGGLCPEEKGETRNVYNELGYESVALVPLRVGNQILGLIHVADYQQNMLPLRMLETLEKAGMRLGQALQRLQAEENVRRFSHELLKAQEQERKKISRELHDSLAQELAALKIGLEILSGDLPTKPWEEIHPRVAEFLQTLQRTMTSVRTLSYDLRPPDLEHFGLVQAIGLYCEEFSARTGIKVDFRAAGIEAAALDNDAAINLYRIVQEGLTNVWRHARAEKVNIKLVASFPKIILRLEDDGRGFNVSEQAASTTPVKHMGLLGMRERVVLLRGKMTLESQLEKGTKITVEIPWKGEGLG